ncbi:hypothetical protein IGI04_040450 [Brassica rapa subsp. trilocularis]|uniref:Uncharacterized protein n=1 Tax=Brassica rapa subsp. trilocularis TaxID=1813537 RepID=A0ABQ7KRD6_BRACM|nr:hypothetical protein IGI04_040450 [Brassica rapa subsp. trilocularis]
MSDFSSFGNFMLHKVFNEMVLIFHLDMFFRSGADFGRYMGSLLGSLLKYNAPKDFLEVLFLWSPGSLLAESSLISSGVQVCLCRGMIYNSFVSEDFHVSRLQPSGRTDLKQKTDFIVSTSEITCLAHISLLQVPKISNKSDPPRIVSFNGCMNHKNFRIKILGFLDEYGEKYIKSFKLVVHGGWCIDGNDNIVNT